MASDNPRNQRQSPHALHVRDVHSLEYRYAAGGETDSPTDPPRTVLKSGTTMRRDSLQMSLGRQLIASVPKDTATPTAQKIPLDFTLKPSPSLFVTPGTPGWRTPEGPDPFHSLFNTPTSDTFRPTDLQTPSLPPQPQKHPGRKENARPHQPLSREDSAKKANEVLAQGLAPWRDRKRQMDLASSLEMEAQCALKKTSPARKRKRLDNKVPVFSTEDASPEPARGHSRGSSHDSTTAIHGTPKRKERGSEETSTTSSGSKSPSPEKEREVHPERKAGKAKMTKHQLVLKRMREEEVMRRRDVDLVSRTFREGMAGRGHAL